MAVSRSVFFLLTTQGSKWYLLERVIGKYSGINKLIGHKITSIGIFILVIRTRQVSWVLLAQNGFILYNVYISIIQGACALTPILCSPRLQQFIEQQNIKAVPPTSTLEPLIFFFFARIFFFLALVANKI